MYDTIEIYLFSFFIDLLTIDKSKCTFFFSFLILNPYLLIQEYLYNLIYIVKQILPRNRIINSHGKQSIIEVLL